MGSGPAVAITGHRPGKLGGYVYSETQRRVRAALRARFAEIKPSMVISGMALGVDQWAAEEAVELGIPFTAAVPFEGQESRWPVESQVRWRLLMDMAAEIVIVSPGGYAVEKMQIRNRWMVDHCDKLIAVWDGSPGGAANCFGYAEARGTVIIRINPLLL